MGIVREEQRGNDIEIGSEIQREVEGSSMCVWVCVCVCVCVCVRVCIDVFLYTCGYGNERVRECVSMGVCVREIVSGCERERGGKEREEER